MKIIDMYMGIVYNRLRRRHFLAIEVPLPNFDLHLYFDKAYGNLVMVCKVWLLL